MAFVIPTTQNDSISNGQWTDYSGSQFKVAYAGNDNFMRVKQRLEQPHRRKIENGTLDPKIHKEIMCKAMSQALLIDWKNVKNDSGDDVQYDSNIAYQALMFDESLREFIMEFSINIQNFKSESDEESVK